jgi:hypothetical protein
MFGIVTAFEGLHVTVEIQERKHVAHMRQACGLGSSHREDLLCWGTSLIRKRFLLAPYSLSMPGALS